MDIGAALGQMVAGRRGSCLQQETVKAQTNQKIELYCLAVHKNTHDSTLSTQEFRNKSLKKSDFIIVSYKALVITKVKVVTVHV